MQKTLNEKLNNVLSVIKTALSHEYFSAVLLLCGFICWFFGLTNLLVYSYVSIFILTLILCQDVKNIFSMVFFVAFFITDITGEEVPWTTYIIAISLAVITLIGFLVKNVITNRKNIKKGQMFYAFIFAGVAFLMGGIQRFNYLAFLITLGLFVATYILYFIIVNFTQNFKDFFIKLFVFGGIILAVQTIITKTDKSVIDFVMLGTQHINVLCEYLLISLICAFVLAIEKDNLLFIVPVLLYLLGVFLTECTTVKILSIVAMVVLMVIAVIKAKKKGIYLTVFGVATLCVLILLILKREEIFAKFTAFFNGSAQDNGRKVLWPWCFDRFKEYPVFGYGFVSDMHVPTTRNNYLLIVLAHNTPLQWLTSLGIVGCLLMAYFYFSKYKIAFSKITLSKLAYALILIFIEVCGLLDQAPAMDFFMFFIPLAIIA